MTPNQQQQQKQKKTTTPHSIRIYREHEQTNRPDGDEEKDLGD